MKRRDRAAGAILTLLLVWLVCEPLAVTVSEALGAPQWSLQHFAEFARRPDEWRALWASLWISVATVGLAAAVGVPLAFLFERAEFPGRRLLGALAALPVVLPPLVGVVAFLFLYGESGFVSRAVQSALRLDAPPWRLSGPGAILLVHAYSMYVYFYLFTRAGLARLDGAYLEAAASLGAGPRADALARHAAPSVSRSLLRGAADLPDRARVLLRALHLRRHVPRADDADPVLAPERRHDHGDGRDERARGGGARGAVPAPGDRRPDAARRGGGRAGSLSAAPRARRLAVGRRRGDGPADGLAAAAPRDAAARLARALGQLDDASRFRRSSIVSNYRSLFAEPERLRPIVNSLWMASVATAAALVVGVAAAWLAVARRSRLRSAIESLVGMPWALPGTVFAVALAAMFSRNQPWAGRFVWSGPRRSCRSRTSSAACR